MNLGGKTQQRSRVTLPVAIALVAFAMACSEDKTGAGGAGGSGGSGTGGSAGGATGGSGGATGGAGGSAGTGGATTGSGGAAGSGATGGAAGSGATGGAAGSGATGGAAGGGTAGKGGAAGSGTAGSGGTAGGGTAGSGTAGGGTAGSGGTAGGSAGSGGTAGGSAGTSGAAGTSGGGDGGIPDPRMNFFVTSNTSKTGNLGGLTGADARCQTLATAAGFGSKTWHAYLSAEAADGGAAVNAKDRIGPGPYFNSKGAMLAADSTALHARSGDAEIFITEKAQKVNGQWSGSPTPNEHDVLTGSNGDGTVLAGQTCINWTSELMTNTAQVGHADGLGPSMSSTPPYNSWNASHANGGCNDTAPKGGAGRLYCFVAP